LIASGRVPKTLSTLVRKAVDALSAAGCEVDKVLNPCAAV